MKNIETSLLSAFTAILLTGGCAASVAAESDGNDKTAARPNFLFLITDQQAIRAMSCAGNPHVKTPNIDRLAARGMRFEKSYCTYASCSPSRASLFTSRMPHELGVNSNSHSPTIPSNVSSMGTLLRAAGYTTAYSGKWHVPASWPVNETRANRRTIPGFDVLAPVEKATPLADKVSTESVARDAPAAAAAVRFLQAAPKQPFALVVSILNPHDICAYGPGRTDPGKVVRDRPLPTLPTNFGVPDTEPAQVRLGAPKSLQRGGNWTAKQWRQYAAVYYQLVETADHYIGQVLDALEQAHLSDNTIIVFTSDHGEMIGSHRLAYKGYSYEESVAVPLIVCVPTKTRKPAVDATHLVSGLDILPTMLDYAGAVVPASLEGRSLRPLFEGRETVWRDHLVGERGEPDEWRARMVRTERYKYCVYDRGDHPEQLFDLPADPGEMKNMATDPAVKNILAQHRQLLRDWIKATNDTFTAPAVPVP